MVTRFLTFSQYHGKSDVGSTRLRVLQLLPYWPEADLYKYGEGPEAIVFQKVYVQPDWRFIEHFKGLKILDICDPDWLDGAEVKRTIDAVDGVTVPTQALAEFLGQLTDKPIKVIPDRHDLSQFPVQAKHQGPIKSVVWFGYKHNAEVLRWVINYLVRKGVRLTVIANEDPRVFDWAENPEEAMKLYTFKKFNAQTLNADLAQHDAALLPVSNRPVDRFKSNNRTIIAHLSGLPVVTDDDSFQKYNDPKVRRLDSLSNLEQARSEYDVKRSVDEMRDFIGELK